LSVISETQPHIDGQLQNFYAACTLNYSAEDKLLQISTRYTINAE